MDQRLKEELDLLKEVYPQELDIKTAPHAIRLQVKVYPLLEDQNIEHHYEYDHPFMIINFDVPYDYPATPPKFFCESSHSKVAIGSHLAEVTEYMNQISRCLEGSSCLTELIESSRAWIFSNIAKKNKHFKKRKHILSDEPAYLYDDDDDDGPKENLMKKAQYTEVTPERFAAWLIAFRAEMKSKQEKDPSFVRKKQLLSKPSGRMIFSERTKEFSNYFDDEKMDDDDEDVDVRGEIREEDDEEDIEVDENLFEDEDIDLDDDEMIIDDN